MQRVSAATGVIEEFYWLRPSIDGIDVLGSEVVVTTDGAGTVTGLFNYYNPGLAEVDTTADAGAGSAAATWPPPGCCSQQACGPPRRQ